LAERVSGPNCQSLSVKFGAKCQSVQYRPKTANCHLNDFKMAATAILDFWPM